MSFARLADKIGPLVRKPLAIATALIALLAMTWEAAPVELRDRPALQPRGVEPSGPRGRLVIGAAGDIACASDPNGPGSPETCQYDETADLIVGTGLDEVLPLGDNQYDVGAFAAFMAYFDPTWGRAFAKMSPVPGNHEHAQDPTSRPGGYFRYFGDRVKGPHRLGYYSYDLGACPDAPCWHLVALDSMLCFAPGGCGRLRPERPWPGQPDVPMASARPREASGRDLPVHARLLAPSPVLVLDGQRRHGRGGTALGPVVRSGCGRRAERALAQLPALAAAGPEREPGSRRGIREFVVGTGGASLYAIPGGNWPTNLVVAQADSFGILRIALKAERIAGRG